MAPPTPPSARHRRSSGNGRGRAHARANGSDSSLMWRQSIIVGNHDPVAGVAAGTFEHLELDELLALGIFTVNGKVLAADPGILRTVSPVEPLPGMLPAAEVNLMRVLGEEIPREADWHVVTVDATPVIPGDVSPEVRSRYSMARISLPSALTTAHVPVRRVRPLPALIRGVMADGICACLIDAPDLPPVVFIVDLLAIVQAELTR